MDLVVGIVANHDLDPVAIFQRLERLVAGK